MAMVMAVVVAVVRHSYCYCGSLSDGVFRFACYKRPGERGKERRSHRGGEEGGLLLLLQQSARLLIALLTTYAAAVWRRRQHSANRGFGCGCREGGVEEESFQ